MCANAEGIMPVDGVVWGAAQDKVRPLHPASPSFPGWMASLKRLSEEERYELFTQLSGSD
jgi:hypothetical protein